MSIQRRLYDCASIGGPYVDAGLGHADADAHYGLIHGTFGDVANLAGTIPGWNRLPLVTVVAMIIERNSEKLTARAAVLQWSKRKTVYDADCASWKAAAPDKGTAWRSLPMTAGQRHLIADTAQILSIEVPEGMNRGTAADWLEANGADVIKRLGGNHA